MSAILMVTRNWICYVFVDFTYHTDSKKSSHSFQMMAPAPTRRQRRLQRKKDKHIVAKATAMVIYPGWGARHIWPNMAVTFENSCQQFCKGALINTSSKYMCLNLRAHLVHCPNMGVLNHVWSRERMASTVVRETFRGAN